MNNIIAKALAPHMQTKCLEGDYTSLADGLVYCGICKTPKQKRFDRELFKGHGDILPVHCQCLKAKKQAEQQAEELNKHNQVVQMLRDRGIEDSRVLDWTFENDDGSCPQMEIAKKYVAEFDKMKRKNVGLLFWGDVGTGKSFLAGCIVNALINKEISARMTNLAKVFAALFDHQNSNDYLYHLNNNSLLVIDDFGIERNTSYGMEQLYRVIDSRYTTGEPLIITTNLTLDELKNPSNPEYKRIYDRVLEMCAPIKIEGESKRVAIRKDKVQMLKEILEG